MDLVYKKDSNLAKAYTNEEKELLNNLNSSNVVKMKSNKKEPKSKHKSKTNLGN